LPSAAGVLAFYPHILHNRAPKRGPVGRGLLLRAACHITSSDCVVYRYSGSALQRLSVERIAARIPHLEQRHGLSSYIRLSSFYVPGTLNAEDLCCGLQEMPPGCPDRRGPVPVPIHHCGVRVVRRKVPLSAVRGVPWTAQSTGGASEADRGELMFDPDANMPRTNRGKAHLTSEIGGRSMMDTAPDSPAPLSSSSARARTSFRARPSSQSPTELKRTFTDQ
jgi:hypothetical protein